MSMTDNEILKLFYLDIQSWIESGCPDSKVFSKHYGLCTNMGVWLWDLGMKDSIDYYKDLLGDSFESAGLHYYVPFNNGNDWDYNKEYNEHTLYENPHRLEWIRKHAMED